LQVRFVQNAEDILSAERLIFPGVGAFGACVDALQRKMPDPQAAILGCTHYPLMHDTFQDALGQDVKVYSQANLVAESLADYLQRHPKMIGEGTESMFLTTGDPAKVSNRATQFLRRKITFQKA
jgi:glutamate racemase